MNKSLSAFLALAGALLWAVFPSSAWANHRTGDFALPEVIVGGDFDHDGKLDLALNVTGFDMVAILDWGWSG